MTTEPDPQPRNPPAFGDIAALKDDREKPDPRLSQALLS
jgi:hypothetical protein